VNGAFYIGATGLAAEQRALDVVANNIANINTTAYKRASIRFSELVGGSAGDVDGAPTNGALYGVMVDSSARDFTQGEIKLTGNAADLAINGDGFVELMGPGGQVMLWRGGTLQVNPDGYLAGADGMPLKAMISVPLGAAALSVSADGKVQALLNGQSTPTVLGQLDLVRIKDVSQMRALDGGLYQAASEADLVTAAPGEDGAGVFAPGALENSNVQLTDEMVTLLLLQRAYSANAQVVQAGDQLMSIANNLRR
jgi:flagellar basal-body rod protein FlgG